MHRATITNLWELRLGYLNRVVRPADEDLEDWLKDRARELEQIEDEGEKHRFSEYHRYEFNERFRHNALLINWFFVACWALFEEQLMEACGRVQKGRGSPFSVDDLKERSTTERVKKYFKRLDIVFPSDAPEWTEITNYQKIRNRIVHDGGKLPRDSHLTAYAKRGHFLSLENHCGPGCIRTSTNARVLRKGSRKLHAVHAQVWRS